MNSLNALHPTLLEVVRGYATLTPIRSLIFPSDLSFELVHNFFLNDILNNPLFLSYPPVAQYQNRFWRWALDHLEEMECPEDYEIDAQLYEHCVSLLPPPSSHQAVGVCPPAPSFVSYIWKDGDIYRSATLLESRTIIEAGTTGLKTWLASLVLAQYLVANPDIVKATSILELGSGVGFLGIIIATLQRSTQYSGGLLHMTDVNDEVLHRCTDNINLPCNASSNHPSINCRSLDWTDALDEELKPRMCSYFQQIHPNLIVGADVAYDPIIVPPLVQTLRLAFSSNPDTSALIALPVRNKDTIAKFIDTAGTCFAVEDVHCELEDTWKFWGLTRETFVDGAQSEAIRILRLRTKPSS